ncbi:MAG TPA: hypothetical protein IAA57_00400 [Candidatus Pullilachnospira intestinigallinarum]|nr:hypothetical protein [Candidatus Pullilachnospira intestinigallinarum]
MRFVEKTAEWRRRYGLAKSLYRNRKKIMPACQAVKRLLAAAAGRQAARLKGAGHHGKGGHSHG